MKKYSVLLLLAILCLKGTSMYGGDNKIFPYKYDKVVLGNGLNIYFIPFDSPGLVAYYSIVRTGSRDEWEEGKSGFAHFFEHMMFRGTDRFPASVYDSIITSIGANANAYTSDDMTVFHLNLATEDLPTVIDLEADRFQNLHYSKEEFQTESGAVYGEYRKGRTSPWSVISEELRNLAFDAHTYKHTTIGFEKDIMDMPNQYDYSISFYNRYYRPNNVVICVVGDFDKDKTLEQIKKNYGAWKPGYVQPNIKTEPPQTAPRKKDVGYDGKTLPMVVLAYKMDSFNTENKNFLASVQFADLAFGATSDLYKKLVLDEQKVQMLSPNPGITRDPYLFEIYVMIKDEKDIDYVITEVKKTIASFAEKPVSDELLNQLKKRNKYDFLMSLDSPDAVAGILPQYITMTGDLEVINNFYNGLDKITPQDIQNSVKKYFTTSNENLIILKGAK